MKLIYFSEQNLPIQEKAVRRGDPRITFTRNGSIVFSKKAVELTSLKDGDKVTLAQDQDNPETWYFFKDPVNGYSIRSKGKYGQLNFQHKEFHAVFMDAMSLEAGETYSFSLEAEPVIQPKDKTKYWAF